MSLEEGTSFWSSNLMWKVFFCAAIAFPTYNAGKNVLIARSTSKFSKNYPIVRRNNHKNSNAFNIDASEPIHDGNKYFFGKFNETTVHFSYSEFPIFILFGILGGVIGALFVNINYHLSIFRMKLVVCFVIFFHNTMQQL